MARKLTRKEAQQRARDIQAEIRRTHQAATAHRTETETGTQKQTSGFLVGKSNDVPAISNSNFPVVNPDSGGPHD